MLLLLSNRKLQKKKRRRRTRTIRRTRRRTKTRRIFLYTYNVPCCRRFCFCGGIPTVADVNCPLDRHRWEKLWSILSGIHPGQLIYHQALFQEPLPWLSLPPISLLDTLFGQAWIRNSTINFGISQRCIATYVIGLMT